MPIRPDERRRYPAHWPQIGAAVRQRSGNRCEFCGAPNRAWGWRGPAGQFHEVRRGPLVEAGYTRAPFTLNTADGRTLRIIEIVLTCAHLDHHPEHNDPANLAALCGACHLAHDQDQHRRVAAANRRLAMATPDLFGAPA